MKPLPLPLRLAAGLAVSARERAKELPRQITGLPITLASQVLQISMRVQQQVTELAIKGDEALSGLQPVEETPSWATFDEDVVEPDRAFRDRLFPPEGVSLPRQRLRPEENGFAGEAVEQLAEAEADLAAATTAPEADEELDSDPWSEEERAISERERKAEAAEAAGLPLEDDSDAVSDNGAVPAPGWLPDYDQLSLPQVRARLRTFSEEQLGELLTYERSAQNRDDFAGMLARRIDTVRAKQSGK